MSSATLRALMEAPSNPRLVNPTAYSPFVPFQPSGKAILGKPSSSLKKSSSLQEPRTMLGNKMSPKSTNGLTEASQGRERGMESPISISMPNMKVGCRHVNNLLSIDLCHENPTVDIGEWSEGLSSKSPISLSMVSGPSNI